MYMLVILIIMIIAVVVEVDKTMGVLGLSLRSDHLAKDTTSTVSLVIINNTLTVLGRWVIG